MRLEYFQLIDRIVDLRIADRKISTEATVPDTSTIFEGHFPGFPLMPGVLLIEAMAQTSGWLVVAVNGFRADGISCCRQGCQVPDVCNARPEIVGEGATLLHEGSGYAITKAIIKLDGKSICDATLTLRVLDFPNDEMKLRMRETAALVGFPAEVPANG